MPETKASRARKMYEATKSKKCLTTIGKKRKRLEILPTKNNIKQYLTHPPKKKQKIDEIIKCNNSNNSNDILLTTLRQRFGFNSFRSSQRNAINSILNGRDVLLLMPTGGGKSITFQLPALILNKLAIVISPLIALMKNHCDSLQRKGIHAKIINSTISISEKNNIFDHLQSSTNIKIEILYTTPEQIKNSNRFTNILNNLYNNNKISLFAIDECHCISSWGHDFRPNYRNLNILRMSYPDIPIIALTATATNNVRNDIIKSLKLRNPNIIVSSFDRPNLYLSFEYIENIKAIKTWKKKNNKKRKRRKSRKKINKKEITAVNQKICDNINIFIGKHKYKNKCGLIYIYSRKDAETMAYYLQSEYKLSIAAYHAGMANNKKTNIQQQWEQHKINIMVCTCAFGMGIDVRDVRFVIHCTINKNLESYYQEIGRGGRDNKFTNILCYYSVNMLNKHKNTLLRETIWKIGRNKKKNKSKAQMKKLAENDALYIQNINNLKYVKQFAEPNKCRREILLNYFGENISNNNRNSRVNCCDFCDNKHKIKTIKLQYEKMRKGKENIMEINNEYEFAGIDNTNDYFDPIEDFDSNIQTHSNFNNRNNNNNNNITYNNDNKEIKEHTSNILLNEASTSNINGLKTETREHGLFEFLSVIEQNIKNHKNGTFDVFAIAQQNELEVFNKSNTSFIYGLNLRQEIENISKCTLYGILWNENVNETIHKTDSIIKHNNSNMNIKNKNIKQNKNNSNVCMDGIYELIQALQIEREWSISLIGKRANFEEFNRWKNELKTVYSKKVNELYAKYKNDLDSIEILNDINNKLNKERQLLLDLINSYNPNQRSQIIWNSEHNDVSGMLQECDDAEKERIQIVKEMKININNTNNNNIAKQEADDESDDDLVILSLNMKHQNVQCLISMGYDSKIINKAWCLLKNNHKTKHIMVEHQEFIIKMLDKMQSI